MTRPPFVVRLLAALLVAMLSAQGKADDSVIAPQGFFARLLFHSFPSIDILPETSAVTADGFDLPVGPPEGTGFCRSRGFRAHGHLGEDWVIAGGKGQAFGHSVHSVGNGLVVLARDIHADWGNVVVIRHAWIQERRLHFADSLYAHLDRIMVREGQQVRRGQQVGTIGNNHGMYPPHLHFEMHKDLSIGVNHAAASRDLISYWAPTDFIMEHRKLHGGGRNVPTPAAHFLLPTPENPWSFHRFFSHSEKKKRTSKTSHSHHSNASSGTTHHSKKKHQYHNSNSSSSHTRGSQ